MSEASTVLALLQGGAAEAVALAAPGRRPLTFAALRAHVDEVVGTLNGFGLGRGERVAIVLPNGPEMAAAFLGVATCAAAAPLNPAYTDDEFHFYLTDLDARAVIVPAGEEARVAAVAGRLGIAVIDLSPLGDREAGLFALSGERAGAPATGGPAQADDVALLLHTSGTTSRPKLVPLRQRHLHASARHIAATLRLTAADCCLNIMPLFHVHGLMAAVLASLGAGASVVCCPPFSGRAFFDWMGNARPTWYTAVPSMHQIILDRAAERSGVVAANRLRFIRSSSAALAPPVMHQLEAVFGAPAIESYGMTEAAHQMTSNPLPPQPRKPGTVGLPAGPEVAIMGEAGTLLPTGETGEVVIRGPNVVSGYENNPAANAQGFSDGWFRTGDQGLFDPEGYLTITGRLKEIINRGGEKISPREVEEVLLAHPAVAEVVAFAIPAEVLGEEVASAIVLHDGAGATEDEIRAFAAARLARFKVPRRIAILPQLPKGPTGKLQRVGLAARLGLV